MPEPGKPYAAPGAGERANRPAAPSLVEVRGLHKSYREGGRDHVILSGGDAVLHRGEFVALLGPSGSGKSTLLNLVSGIDTPDAGSVVVDGVDLTAATERERTLFRRRHIGFVFQFFNLLPTLTVMENLLLPLELSGGIREDGRQKARSLLGEVGLTGREDAFPDRLSGGEQQRVAVARALVHEPKLVLADEPTGNLDSTTGTRVIEILEDLARQRDVALLVVTHSPEIARSAHRVLGIHEGRLVDTSI